MGRIIMPTTDEILRFVEESNAIENIFVDGSHPLVRDHVRAVRLAIRAVKSGKLPSPQEIHRVLLKTEYRKFPGIYRFGYVMVEGSTLLAPHLVPLRMQDLLDRVRQGPKGDVEEWIWNVHFEFEHIHPFFDGNGRTGRIWMNAMRLLHGLPWLTITREERQEYFARIRAYRGQTKSIWQEAHRQKKER